MNRSEPNVNLRTARQSRHWSRETLAEQLGVSVRTIGRWERGEGVPEAADIVSICQLFELTREELGWPMPQPEQPAPVRIIIDAAIPSLPAVPLIGREQEMTEIKQRLTAGERSATTALHGLPGVGKTTLATALVHDQAIREHFHDGILWTSLGPHPNLPGLLGHWGALLGFSARRVAQLENSEEWALALRTAIGERKMLLVIDDAWTVEAALAFQVGGPNCAHLLTTRSPHIAAHISIDGTLALHELSSEQGMHLLRQLAPQVGQIEQAKAQALVQAVGGLPLALTLMGNYLRRQAYTGQMRRVNAALQRLSNVRERLHMSLPAAPLEEHSSLPGTTPISLQSVIEVTDQLLDARSRAALYALAIFPAKPSSFAEEAALVVADCSGEVLDQLADAGLLESSAADRYMLHQTIADYARQQVPEAESNSAYSRLVNYVVDYLARHKHDYEQLDLASAAIFVALDAADRLGQQTELLRGVLAFMPFLLVRAWYEQAEALLQRAHAAAQNGGDPAAIADTLHYLGELAHKRGHYAQAESCLQEGLTLARQLADDERICTLLTDLGHVIYKRGDYTRAQAYLLEGLALARQIAEPERVCDLLRTLSSLENGVGNYEQAETYLQEGIALARQSGNRELILTLLINLGASMGERGNHTSSERYFQEGLALARQIGHREAMSVLLANLGDAASELGRYEEAERYFQEGMALAKQIDHREWTCGLLINLGTMLRKQGSYQQAESYLQESLALAREISRPQMIANALYEYGNVCLDQQQFTQAKHMYSDMLAATPEMARDLLALAQYGLAQVAAHEGNIAAAREQGSASAATLTAMKHRNAQEVQTWLKNL